MNEEEIKKILDASELPADYDLQREETLRGMMASAFQSKPRWMMMIATFYAILFSGIAIFAGVKFFQADQVRGMIMYATIFLASLAIIIACKTWGWQLIQQNMMGRELKRLELRIVELAEAVRGK